MVAYSQLNNPVHTANIDSREIISSVLVLRAQLLVSNEK